jgi:predicted ATP-dependent endonuclease of OLD family
MDLFQVDISGFRKFKDPSVFKTRGKVLAVLGPNEAGKSSLLKALLRLADNQPFQPHEISRGVEDSSVSVVARFLLSEEDKLYAGVPDAVWYVISKEADGICRWSIEPRPRDRDYSHRHEILRKVKKIASNQKLSKLINPLDDDLINHTLEFFDEIKHKSDLTESGKSDLDGINRKWSYIAGFSVPKEIGILSALITSSVEIENRKSERLVAGERLFTRMPSIILFGDDQRNLKASYAWNEIVSEIPPVLENLARLADLDLVALANKMIANVNDPDNDTIIERANNKLKTHFHSDWNQFRVSVALSKSDQFLLIQVYNNQGERTDLYQRSDGLRQFVALRCFAAARRNSNFILLIDEAEQHLHYDAQADLVQMFGQQTLASKVIYTTHSLGCLPEDLGQGVRLVVPTAKDSDWSRIENKFWAHREDNEAAFSPILMGMGAGTMAFFPTRSAVLTEGPSDTILYPTMFREALCADTVGVQFVHGLSEDGRMQLPLLNSTGLRVCYLLDNDSGGRILRDDLFRRGVDKSSVFLLKYADHDVELEDFLDSHLLAKAVNSMGKRHLGLDEIVKSNGFPRVGKWDFIKNSFDKVDKKVFSKTEIAYAVLEEIDQNPSTSLLDARLRGSFRTLALKVVEQANFIRQPNVT